VEAIQAGRVEPVFRDGPLLRGLGSVYTAIHQFKGQLGSTRRPKQNE
jgi:hypothetical protein